MGGVHVVGIADCAASANADELLATYALGSCVAVVMHDPVAVVGGLLHFLLPECSIVTVRGRENPFVYADTGVPELVKRCLHLGADRRRLIVHAAGGANLVDDRGVFDIGRKNQAGLREAVRKAGLKIRCESIGGHVWRFVSLNIGTGKVSVKEESPIQ